MLPELYSIFSVYRELYPILIRILLSSICKIIKIYWENKYFLKLDQSYFQVTLMYSKSNQGDPKVSQSHPNITPN